MTPGQRAALTTVTDATSLLANARRYQHLTVARALAVGCDRRDVAEAAGLSDDALRMRLRRSRGKVEP